MHKAVLNVKDSPQLDAEKVAERIGVSLSDWPGNCYAIACKLVKSKIVKGRPAYGLRFSPRPGLRASTLGDRALNALVGRVVVDASDLQVVSVEARLVSPVKVGGGLAASIREAAITYRAQRLGDGAWLPCLAELRVRGRTALFFRLDSAFRFEFSGFARYSVEVETDVGRPSVQSAP